MNMRDQHGECNDLAELEPCSAADALRREPASIEVDDGQQVLLTPMRRSHHRYFARVRLASFADLQLLGFVPRRLKEQAVRTAIANDDEAALRVAEGQLRGGQAPRSAPCGCHASTDGQAAAGSLAQDLHQAYRQVRREYHPALARVLSEHFGVEFA